MLSHGLFSLLTERLMLHSNQFTMTTYNVLFEVSPLRIYSSQACAYMAEMTIKQQLETTLTTVYLNAVKLTFISLIVLFFVFVTKPS